MKELRIAGLVLKTPVDWADVTAELPAGSPPTLQCVNGVGALQVTVALYRSGKPPNFDRAALRELLIDWAIGNELPQPRYLKEWDGVTPGVVADYSDDGEEVLLAWSLSDGLNMVVATYLTYELRDYEDELDEVERIMSSLSFAATKA